MVRWLTFAAAAAVACSSGFGASPHTVWLEAENFAPLHGSNFSYQRTELTTKGSWSLSGPGVAAEWTQGGESEFMSIAARADEPGEVVCGTDAELPAAGRYTLWVRYADYRAKKESFGVRVRQGNKTFAHTFGERPVVDELDPMKLLWDWAFGWDHTEVDLDKGSVRVELFTTGPTEARRQVDCLCLTTDAGYHPAGREKPDCAAWKVLREFAGVEDAKPLVERRTDVPKSWRIADGPPHFFWNTGKPWLDELKRPEADRVEWPFTSDPPTDAEFLKTFRGKPVSVYGDPLSGPAVHIPDYPALFSTGSDFLAWLDRHPDRKFAILLNYGEPNWPDKPDRHAVYANFIKYKDRFAGFVAGESMSYDAPDGKTLDEKVRAAKTRGDVLAALREAHDAATARKFSDYFAAPIAPADAWARDIPCMSAGMEMFSHALADWGVRHIGHENSGNSPTLSRRLAFLRGAARQFGARVADYQSCNLGDASTIFDRQNLFYPASSRYILDNQYDAWAGSGLNWVLKDYLLFWLAGADVFYHEEGNDIYWKPGGNSAGDEFPIGLSPRGRVTEAVMKLAAAHPVGVQITPIAFLLDEAHGYSQERFSPAGFGLERDANPALLAPGLHEDAIRGWFDVAYFPAPLTQNEPAGAIRQTYVNGVFGDIFDVIVTSPGHAGAAANYPVLIAAGQVPLTDEWGQALREYVDAGGTLVVCDEQFSGPGLARLQVPAPGPAGEAAEFKWNPTGRSVESNVFRFRSPSAEGATVLAESPDGKPIAVLKKQGKGQLIVVGVPLGLGIDRRPTPVLALLMRDLAAGVTPVKVTGDVEWTVSRLDDGGLLVSMLNNRGINKPQHGVLPTDYRESQRVQIRTADKFTRAAEWVTGASVPVEAKAAGSTLTIEVPAGVVRLVAFEP